MECKDMMGRNGKGRKAAVGIVVGLVGFVMAAVWVYVLAQG